MKRTDLTQYDVKPEAMVNYLRYFGPHFSKRLCEFAVRRMKGETNDGRKAPIAPWSKTDVDALLEKYGISVENDMLYDTVFVANMCKADQLGKGVPNEEHVAKFVKAYLDDPDGYDGIAFNRWYADCCKTGVAIDWENMM